MSESAVPGHRRRGLAVKVCRRLVPVLLEAHRLADLEPLPLELVVLVLLGDVLPLEIIFKFCQ